MIHDDIQQALRNKIIPWIQADGIQRLVYLDLPLRPPAQVRCTAHGGPPLVETGTARNHSVTSHWAEERVNSIRFPYFGVVLDGEADLRMGVTQRMVRAHDEHHAPASPAVRFYSLAVPQRTCFLIPPRVPISDASGPHWDREAPQSAYSRIFWLHCLPAGVFCHICTSSRGAHHSHPLLYLPESRVAGQMDAFMDELNTRGKDFALAAQANLLSLLVRVDRALENNRATQFQEHGTLEAEGQWPEISSVSGFPGQQEILHRARQFIRAHSQENLTVESIARNTFVSVTQLNRVFRANGEVSVMQFVVQCRMDVAKTLLTDTNLPINQVGDAVGYVRKSHFGRVFLKEMGMSPGQYRIQHRTEKVIEN